MKAQLFAHLKNGDITRDEILQKLIESTPDSNIRLAYNALELGKTQAVIFMCLGC